MKDYKLKKLIEQCEEDGYTRFVVLGMRQKTKDMVDLRILDNLGEEGKEAVVASLEAALDAFKESMPQSDKKEITTH